MKYRVGDKVRVRKDLVVGKEYDSLGTLFCSEMERWRGKTVTIAEVDENLLMYTIKEDRKQFSWVDEMLDPAPREIRIIIDGRTVTAIEGEYKGVARCSPEDKFDLELGVRLAVLRLDGSQKWPQMGDDCFKVTFSGSLGKFTAFKETVESIELSAVGKLIFRTPKEAQKMADNLNAVLEGTHG